MQANYIVLYYNQDIVKKKTIVIGTRGSQLSLVQTNLVKELLTPHVPQTTIEITTITTKGDKNMKPIPLDTIGKGWFTKEIDKQMLDGTIDMAVHSLKDLLDTLTNGLTIAAIPEREDPREALVTNTGRTLKQLKKGAIIGTDSLRRKIQILELRPDLEVKSVRGNVNKRLEKLDTGEYDGLFLAVAGLKRLGLESRITEYFDAETFIPSPGQGALAVVCKIANKELFQALQQMEHKQSLIAVTAERAFSAATGGGCSMPVGAYAQIKQNILTLYGMIGSEDGKHIVRGSIKGTSTDPRGLAEKLAERLLKKAASWYDMKKVPPKQYVITTRAKADKNLTNKLKSLGLTNLNLAVTKQVSNLAESELSEYLTDLSKYHWLIFTSSNGVLFFTKALKKLGINIADLSKLNIAAVGPQTAAIAQKHGMTISFIPSNFSSNDLAKELPDLKNQTVLLARSAIGKPALKKQLEEKGARVTDMPLYTTKTQSLSLKPFYELVENKQIAALTFTSPSSVNGFVENLLEKQKQVLQLPVYVIGKSTASAAERAGFKTIFIADRQTMDAIIRKISESIL